MSSVGEWVFFLMVVHPWLVFQLSTYSSRRGESARNLPLVNKTSTVCISRLKCMCIHACSCFALQRYKSAARTWVLKSARHPTDQAVCGANRRCSDASCASDMHDTLSS